MTGRNWRPQCVTPWAVILAALILCLRTAGADAQTIGPDEAVNANGAVTQQLALTQAQKAAIYNTVLQQRGRTSTPRIPVTVGAPVSPMAELAELPDQAAADAPLVADLKYAMVE